jgi:hypothetical protein
MDNFKETHRNLVDEVYKQDYYINRLPVQGPIGMTHRSVHSFWGSFWWNLPGRIEIHTPLFYKICDFIEELADHLHKEEVQNDHNN